MSNPVMTKYTPYLNHSLVYEGFVIEMRFLRKGWIRLSTLPIEEIEVAINNYMNSRYYCLAGQLIAHLVQRTHPLPSIENPLLCAQ